MGGPPKPPVKVGVGVSVCVCVCVCAATLFVAALSYDQCLCARGHWHSYLTNFSHVQTKSVRDFSNKISMKIREANTGSINREEGKPTPACVCQVGCQARVVAHGTRLIESRTSCFVLCTVALMLLSTLWYMTLARCSSEETQSMTV